MKFTAAVLVKSNAPLELMELEAPPLRFGQVLVQIHYSGICGAQINEIEAAKGPDKFLPHCLGHEGCATVQEVGEGVKHVAPGDLVVLHWRQGAGIQADPARYGSVNAGWVTTFQTHAVVSENRLTRIPGNFDQKIAPLFGCAVTTAFGVVNNDAHLKVGQSVLVIGVGGVGLPIVQACAMVSAHPIWAMDLQAHKLAVALGRGATDICMQPPKRTFDVVIETTGDKRMIEAACELTHPDGKTVLVGVPREKVEIYTLPYHFRKTIHGSHGGSCEPHLDIPRYIELVRAKKLDLSGLVTDVYPLDKINEAIAHMRSGRAGRVMVQM